MVSLMELRAEVQKRGKISLVELANEFRTSKELIEPMMERLVQKGTVETWTPAHHENCGCGDSCACGVGHNPIRYYRWVG